MLHLFRAPQSASRPEAYIGDEIQKALFHKDVDFCNHDDIIREDPDNGEMFYHPRTFLDNLSSLVEKFSEVKDGDVCFFIEGLSPAPLALRYYLSLMGIKDVKICGIFHSGCDVPGDLFNNDHNMRSIEKSLMVNLDHVFVATDYMASFLDIRNIHCHVTGLPYDSGVPDIRGRPITPTENPLTIIFNHRWSDDKNKQVFLDLAEYDSVNRYVLLSPKPVDCGDNVELRLCTNREQYRRNLKEGDIVFSSAILETFGYSVIEGVLSGMMPYVPDKASYKELIDYRFRYDVSSSIEEIHSGMLKVYKEFYINRPDVLTKNNQNPEKVIVNKLLEII